ncbi:putative ribonuclease H-like domain-containing protein [Tanacetum coccineum]
MNLETAQITTTAKLHTLKQENGNAFKPAAKTTTNADGTSTTLIPGLVTTGEKVQKKNDMKARSMLLMTLPNEHLMTFNQYKDAKTLFAAIQTRFGGNEATKKTQKTLLKQMYENLVLQAQSLLTLFLIGFRRLNKPVLDTMSFNDLYNNFKIIEQEVKGTAISSSSLSSQNVAFVSSSNSTNEVNTAYRVSTANTQVSPASTQVSTASTQVSTANLCDDTVYAFLASQPNGSQLIHEDLEQIHKDDLEKMDLKWQLALLSMRRRRFFQKTGRNITINGSDTARYDKSKVECFNCHKLGHFARECKGTRNQDSRNRNQDSSRRTVNVEETSSKAMLAIDGAGFDWSYMADDEVPTNMALMAFSDSEVHNDKTCSKTCLKSFETLKTQLDDLRIEFNKSEFNLANYKRGLASVKEQLVFYKKNEVIFYEQLAVLKRDISYKDSEISVLKGELEKLKQEKESNQLKIENFDNASKSLDKLIGSQIPDKSRKGLGFVSYNVVPPPPTGLFLPPNLDLSNSGLEEFQQPEFEGYGPKTSNNVSEDTSNEVRESPDAPLVEELVSDDKLEKKTTFPTVAKIDFVKAKQQEKPVRKPVKYVEMYSFDHVQANCNYHQRKKVVSGNNYTRGHPQKEDQGYVDSRCSRHMTGNMSYLSDFKEFDGGYVTFGGGAKGGKITCKETLKTCKLDFDDVYFVKELQFNFFSISQMCDKKNNVLFTDTPCFVLSHDFKLADESQVLLKVPRKNNMYNVDMKNIVPKESLTCIVAKATLDESMLWHKRLGIKREFSIASTPQQNDVAERRNRTLIEAAKTMLADSKLPTTFWAEAVNTACYVKNRVLVVKPHNKTPYELFRGRTHALSFMRPFGCHVTILNTLDYLGKFDGKSDEGFFVGYSLNSKAFRVYNIRTRKVEENLHIRFLEDKPIIAGDGPKWLFDINVLTKSMNYVPVVAGTNSNDLVGTKESIGAGHSSKETGSSQDCILMPLWKDGSLFDSSSKNASNDEPQPSSDAGKKDDVTTARSNGSQTEPYMFSLGDNATLEATHFDFFGDETEVDMSNITTTYPVPSTSNIRIHKDHSLDHVIGDVQSGVLTRRMTKTSNEQGFISAVYEGKTHEDLHTCLFACFLSQLAPKKVIQALTDPSWIEAMQDELLLFKLQKVWTLVDLPYGKRAIGTKWVYKNKKDKRCIVIRNKARLVAQDYTQEEGIDYDEVFALVARIEAIRLFLAYALFKDFVVYQIDVKSAFLYGKIEEEVYVCQPSGFEDLEFPDRVYKKDDGIFISQDKYVDEILKKFAFSTVKTTSTPMETSKPLLKDVEAEDVDVHLYRSMIGSLMYLTASRPDIMFVVCACARFQVTPKVSHLHAVKRIFRYLKGQPKLGLWYPKDSPFDLEAYTDSDYAGASLDRKSTTGGCQFLGSRLISWQCKKQTIVANSTTEAEYVAAASCCGQVLWIQNQMLDYGYNFMNTKIYIDNESTICIVKNPVFHSKTKHIEIRHHFIRDSNEKKLIQMSKIHTDHNVADLLTKAFDSSGPIPLVIKEWEDRMERAATTASSLEAEQDSGNINRTQSMETLNESFPQGTGSGSGPRVNTLGNGKDNMKLKELMDLCTKLLEKVLDLG